MRATRAAFYFGKPASGDVIKRGTVREGETKKEHICVGKDDWKEPVGFMSPIVQLVGNIGVEKKRN